jgi:hypothetical protein
MYMEIDLLIKTEINPVVLSHRCIFLKMCLFPVSYCMSVPNWCICTLRFFVFFQLQYVTCCIRNVMYVFVLVLIICIRCVPDIIGRIRILLKWGTNLQIQLMMRTLALRNAHIQPFYCRVNTKMPFISKVLAHE